MSTLTKRQSYSKMIEVTYRQMRDRAYRLANALMSLG